MDRYLMVLVTGDEEAMLGVIPPETYDRWNDRDIDTGTDDHGSLFHSEHVFKIGSYAEIEARGFKIVGIKGGIAY